MKSQAKVVLTATDPDEERWVRAAGRIVQRINKNPKICDANKQLITEFCTHLKANGSKPRTIVKHIYFIEKILSCLNDGQELLKIDNTKGVDMLVANLNALPTVGEATKANIRFTLKQIFRWHNEGEMPKYMRGVDTEVKVKRRLGSNDILTPEECDKLVANAGSLRNMAMLALCTTVPLRPHEVLKLRRSDFNASEVVPYIIVPEDTKTGSRKLFIPKAAHFVSQYLNANADIGENDYLFESYMGGYGQRKRMTYNAFSRMFKIVAKRIGLPEDKRYIYVMRHTVITTLHKSNQVSSGTLEKIAGWRPGGSSRMLKTYSHISDFDVRDSMLRAMGMKPPEDEAIRKALIKCPRCGTDCPASLTSSYCSRCGCPLDIGTIQRIEKSKVMAVESAVDPEKAEEFRERRIREKYIRKSGK